MNFYWRRVESQEKLQRRGNSVHNITLVGFRGQILGHNGSGKHKRFQRFLKTPAEHLQGRPIFLAGGDSQIYAKPSRKAYILSFAENRRPYMLKSGDA
jgi:hypothetical protein